MTIFPLLPPRRKHGHDKTIPGIQHHIPFSAPKMDEKHDALAASLSPKHSILTCVNQRPI